MKAADHLFSILFAVLVQSFGLGGAFASAQQLGRVGRPRFVPQARRFDSAPLERVQQLAVPGIDRALVAVEDAQRKGQGLPARYAIPNQVRITPDTHGTFEEIDTHRTLWRLRIQAPGASSINLGFTRYVMPEGGQLMVYSADGRHVHRPFTHADNELHGQLWTPVVLSDEMVVELTIPKSLLTGLELELTHVGYGYRGFGASSGSAESGSCNVDVVCPGGDPWRGEIPAVGAASVWGYLSCTGFMVNNTSNDRTPYFMSSLDTSWLDVDSAPTLVVYWNYETSTCGGSPDGTLTEFNTGSIFRSSDYLTDFVLVQLDDNPDPGYGVTFAGWDRTGLDVSGAVVIHHPGVEEKRISFENDPTTTTSFFGDLVPGDGTHIRIADWDVGATEWGSQGAPLFNSDHRVIGQCNTGNADCLYQDPDWAGKFSVSWTGGGTPDTRLSDWLDAAGTGALTVDTLGLALAISPSSPILHEGGLGGPLSNSQVTYTLTNRTTAPIDYQVSRISGSSILIDGGNWAFGVLPANGGSVQVSATLGPAAGEFVAGRYVEQLGFYDWTNSVTTAIDHVFEIGRTEVFSFPLDSDPGWTREGQWAFGAPTGAGGQYGLPDPTSGFTGSSVLGYNLAGDYSSDLPETNLTSSVIDCSGLSGVTINFKRWLNVEEPSYDHASFRVSNDGTNYVTFWENDDEVTDSSWRHQDFDISAVADDQATVYLRWTMGTTDGSWSYSGWNIDDIRISAIEPGIARITEIITETGDGTGSTLRVPLGIASDGQGNVYVTGFLSDNAFRIAPGGMITEIIDSTGDGQGNTLARPRELAVDGFGNVYVAASGSDCVFKIADPGLPTQTITVIVDSAGDRAGNPLAYPRDIAVDGFGNVYVGGEASNNAFKITDPGLLTQTITEIIDATGDGAGNPLDSTRGIAVDGFGNVYVAGFFSDNMFKITDPGGTNTITEIIDETGDGMGNLLYRAGAVLVDGTGNVYLAGEGSSNVYRITPGGVITEIIDASGDGAGRTLMFPSDIAVDALEDVYVTGDPRTVFKITDPGGAGTITEILDPTCTMYGMGFPEDIVVDESGMVYVALTQGDKAITIFPLLATSDGEGDGLSDVFESGFGGDGISIMNPETGNTATASGSAAGGATIDSGSFSVELPPGTSVQGGAGATLDFAFDPDPDRPKVAISGADLAGQTKSVLMPMGTSTVVCIDDRPNAVIELLDAGACPPPPPLPSCPSGKISIPIPDTVGASTTVNTMTQSPECAPATYTITRQSVGSVRIDGLAHSAVGLRPAKECFLVIGNGPGNAPFYDDEHLFLTQVDRVEDSHVVRMESVPEFALPGPGPARAGIALTGSGGGGPGTTWKTELPEWMWDGVFTVQILLWDPQGFPQQPEQYSRPLYVHVLSDGSLWTQPYGTGTGIDSWIETGVNAAGRPVLRIQFTVPGY